MQYPKVSVIIPAYNYGHLLAKAISSVRRQGLDDIEIVVVNDASTDNTEKVVMTLAANDLVYICNPHNLGVNKSMNIGFKRATGEYVCVLAADDVLPAGSLRARLDHIIAQDWDAVHAGTTVVSNGVRKYIPPLNTSSKSDIAQFLEQGHHAAGINNATFMYNRRVFDKIGYRDETDTYFPHNDFEFALRTLLHCDVAHVDAEAYVYEIHTNSHSAVHATNDAAHAKQRALKQHYRDLFMTK